MSEFFKAATRCDITAADKAPMYVDRTAMMEDQYRAQRLVEQAMRTELLMREIEASHKPTGTSGGAEEDVSTVSPIDTPPAYRTPPHCTTHLAPEERNLGAKAIQRSMNDRANVWRQKLELNKAHMDNVEGREAVNEAKQYTYRQQEAERELNALVVSRQIAAREMELERVRAAERQELGKRRVHPIDVLHQRIAEELARDVSDASGALTDQLAADAVPIERTYEDEQLRAIREYRRGPSTHIPSAMNVTR